jgi:hypothetical protein
MFRVQSGKLRSLAREDSFIFALAYGRNREEILCPQLSRGPWWRDWPGSERNSCLADLNHPLRW